MLGLAVLASVGGGVWTLVAGDVPTDSSVADPSTALGAGLVPDGTTTAPAGDASGAETAATEPTSKGVFRVGFSFVAGFCIGLFVRAVLKLAAIAVGFWLVMTFALAQADLVHVDWHAINDLFASWVARVERDIASFRGFVLGSLPAAGLGATGLLLGFRRR
ncbi:MAG: FUN14 domain-containing protein [Planctomycetota bacterium]